MRRDGKRQTWVMAAVLGLSLCRWAEAGTFPVFGPETFTRSTGKPVTVTRTFTVPSPTATTWVLHLDNGGSQGELGRVTSAEVKLNGNKIFGPPDFKAGTAVLEKPVRLEASNRLTVEIASAPGSGFSLRIDGRDDQPPALAITSPADGSAFFDPEITVNGTATDPLSGLAGVTCNGAAASVPGISGGSFSCGLTLSPGANAVTVQARDAAGNTSSAGLTLTLAERPPVEPPAVHITAPGPGLVTRDGAVTVTGTISRSVLSVAVNGVEAILQGNTFTALDVPLGEGINRLLATAQTGMGESASDAVSVRRDTHPPQVVIETPRNGERLVSDTVTVAGTVNDLIPGATVNADDVQVTLNGVPAAVDNRTFLLPDVPLSIGENLLVAEAADRAGNRRTSSIRVTREPGLAGLRVVIAGGNNQRGPIKTPLPEPLAVRLLGPDGQPLPNRPVELAVTKGDGLLGDPTGRRRKVTLLTDGDGRVSVPFTVGSRTGEGFHRVRATTPGSLTFAEFCATALPGAASRIAIARRPPLRGVAGQALPESLSVIVTDSSGNPVADVPVTFAVEFGGGGFDEQPAAAVNTNRDGIAETVFTLGASPGRANNQVSASFLDNPGMPAVFLLSGYEVGPPAETRISGIVQNSAGQPILGAEVEVEETGRKTLTGPDGRFAIPIPPGGHHVSIDGATANDPARSVFYPYLELAVEAISGVDNPLDQAVVLPFLDMENAKVVGGDGDVVLGIRDVPGFALKVFAHSTIHHHDGTRAPVLLSSSQVSFDKVPMPPPQGAVPLFFGTLQPGGIHFDPPAQVIYPNTNGLAPGDVADLFSFDHQIGQFVNVGPGTVSEDGTVIVSDPGFGIVATGWHGATRAPSPTGQAANGCGVQVEWQQVKSDGTLGPLLTGGPAIVTTSEEAMSARVRALSFPGGGSFSSPSWTGGMPVVALSGESAAGNAANVTVTAGDTGDTTRIASPTYHFPAAGQPDETCAIDLQVHAVEVDLQFPFLSEQEETTQGAFVPVNADNDNGSQSTYHIPQKRDFAVSPIAQEDDLEVVTLVYKPGNVPGKLRLRVKNNGRARVRIWTTKSKDQEIALPHDFKPEELPEKVYIEGLLEGEKAREIELYLEFLRGQQVLASDQASLTVTPVLQDLKVEAVAGGVPGLEKDPKFGYSLVTEAGTPKGVAFLLKTAALTTNVGGYLQLSQTAKLSGRADLGGGVKKTYDFASPNNGKTLIDVTEADLPLFIGEQRRTGPTDGIETLSDDDSPSLPVQTILPPLGGRTVLDVTYSFVTYAAWQFSDGTVYFLGTTAWNARFQGTLTVDRMFVPSLAPGQDHGNHGSTEFKRGNTGPAMISPPVANKAKPDWR